MLESIWCAKRIRTSALRDGWNQTLCSYVTWQTAGKDKQKLSGNWRNKVTESSFKHIPLRKDVFLRSHVVEVEPKAQLANDYNEPKWPEYVLVFDTETTLDPKDQSLLFGFYRVCRLRDDVYHCVEEGLLYANDLLPEYREVISRYVRTASSEVAHKDYDDTIHVYSQSEFMEKLFFNAIQAKGLIVAFNAPWDISRLAVRYRVSNNRAWTLILSQREFDPQN